MSELELSLFRQRSHEALKQKARRGALFLGVAAGYVRIGHDRIEKDPDQRVQDALRLVFANTSRRLNHSPFWNGSGLISSRLPRFTATGLGGVPVSALLTSQSNFARCEKRPSVQVS